MNNLLKRINWFQVSKLALPLFAGFVPGAASVGVIANFANALKSSWNNRDKKSENSDAINTAIEGFINSNKIVKNFKHILVF